MNRPASEAGEMEPVPSVNGHAPLEASGHRAGAELSSVQTAPTPPRQRPAPFWRSLLLPLAVAAAFGGGAYVAATHFMTPWYSSQATLWFPATGGGAGVLSELVGGGGAEPGSIPLIPGYSAPQFGAGPATAVTALASGRATNEVMTRLNLAAHWHLSGGQAAARLQKNVTYGVDRNGLLAIQATDTDPQFAQRIVNAYIQAMQDVSTELSTAYTHRTQIVLARKRDQAVNKLNAEEDALVRVKTRTMRDTPLGASSMSMYTDLANQKSQTQIALQETQAQIAALGRAAQKTYGNNLALAANVPFAQGRMQQLRDLESQLAVARATLGPDNPALQEAQIKVDQARSQVKTEMARQLTAEKQGITPDVAALYVKRNSDQAKLDGLNQAMAALKVDALSLPAELMQEARLQRQITLDTGLVTTLATATQQAELAEQRDVPSFKTVDAASVSGVPVSPRVTFMTAFAMIAGFLLAMAWQIARSVMRQPMLVDGIHRWTERYIINDPLDTAPTPRLPEEAPRTLSPGARNTLEAGADRPSEQALLSERDDTRRPRR